MERTRLAVLAALCVVLSAGGAALAMAGDSGAPAAAAVSWPTSTLLVSEIQTGGSSASDEFAEITNVGAGPVDLVGLEIVYVTSTGSTVTRKATWASGLVLEPGRHLLIANSAGVFAGLADATYSGGFAATGGAIVLRPVGGAPIDAAGWGDATNAFVEALPAAAPAAGASIERRPAGVAGNTVDTNDNAADFLPQPAPNPQSLAAPPVPAPGASPSTSPGPSSTPTSAPTAAPTATPAASTSATMPPDPSPTPEPSAPSSAMPSSQPSPSVVPTSQPTPTAEPTPTPAPTPTPTPTQTLAPTPEATAVPTPTITATPSPALTIVEARALPNGSSAHIEGVLTTPLGALEAGRKAFVQDDTAGIAVHLDVAAAGGLPAGTVVSVTGTVDDRFAERTLRAAIVDVVGLGSGPLPAPLVADTGAVGEPVEGQRVLIQGLTVGSPSELSDGVGLMVDDGSGAVRVIVGPGALAGAGVPSGTIVTAVGPVGQRDSSGTGLAGYRIHVTEPGDFLVVPPPSPGPTIAPPTPSPSVTPTQAPTGAPSAAPTPSPSPTPGPTATPAPTATASPGPTPPATLTIVEARGAPVGTVVTVIAVVSAEAGRIGLPPLLAIADSTGGIVVRLPESAPPPARGALVQVRGAVADPYGQLELRPASAGFTVTGTGSLPAPVRLDAADLGEATEGRLAELKGTVASAPTKGTSGDFSVNLTDASGATFRVVCDASSGIDPAMLVKGKSYRVTGIVGQRASRKGALDGYRLYLRDANDVVAVASGSGGPGGGGAAPVSIATALAYGDETAVVVEGTVTAPATLLDATGRRIVIQDASGAIEVLLPIGTSAPPVGTKLRVGGSTGHAYGAPRIGAKDVESLGKGSVGPVPLSRPPAERDEWQLVRISGTVEKVQRMGDRWRAEIVLPNGARAPVSGQAGAGIPSTAIVAGRTVTVVGIVRRPYPTATDRRFSVLPRDERDLALGPGGGDGGSGYGNANPGAPSGPGIGASGSPIPSGVDITPDTDLAVLADHVGQRVRIGGLISRLTTDGFELDDGTALAAVRLDGAMAQLLPHLHAGEAVAATGIVELDGEAPIVVVDDDGALFRVGTLGQALPIGEAAPSASAPPDGSGPLTADVTGLGPDLGPTSAMMLAGLALLSVAATIVRRRIVKRRLRAVLVGRLAGLRDGEAHVPGAPVGESRVAESQDDREPNWDGEDALERRTSVSVGVL